MADETYGDAFVRKLHELQATITRLEIALADRDQRLAERDQKIAMLIATINQCERGRDTSEAKPRRATGWLPDCTSAPHRGRPICHGQNQEEDISA